LHECGYQKSKLPQASLRPFHFLTANPGKPLSVSRVLADCRRGEEGKT